MVDGYIISIGYICYRDKISTTMYFTNPSIAFSKLLTGITHIHTADILMLGSGWVGAIVAGFVIRNLRRSGYSMF